METLNNKITGGNLTAAEWNQVPSELQNVITQTGQALTNADLNQLGKGIAEYAANGDFYTDSGAANAYVLTQIGTKQAPTSYVNGLVIRFVPGNTNTSASTVNVASLGVKSIVNFNGSALVAGEIATGDPLRAFFDLGNDRFQLLLEIGTNNYSLLKSGRKNFLINGSMDLWQRGISFTAVEYTADRWSSGDASRTVTRVASPFKGSVFAMQIQGSGGISPQIDQLIELDETGNIAPFKTFTDYSISFEITDVSAGADIRLFLDLVDDSAGNNGVSVISSTNVGTTINGTQRIEFTFNFGNPAINGTNQALRIGFFLATADSVFILGRVQFEEGSNATAFEEVTIGDELVLAQRYFEKSYDLTVDPGTINANGRIVEKANRPTTTTGPFYGFLTRKRVAPTITLFSSTTGASGFVDNNGDKAATIQIAGQTGVDSINITAGTISDLRYHFTADAEL